MWSSATRSMNISGTVRGLEAGAPVPLPGVAVDVYRYRQDELGAYHLEQMDPVPAMTDAAGTFGFTGLPVTVEVQTVIPGTPPYLPVELVRPESLPNLVFRLLATTGSQFVELLDERLMLDPAWEAAHPERQQVPLTGSAAMTLEVPEVAGSAVPHDEFHLLRVGRAIRDEIGEIGEARPLYADYHHKAGYMISSDARTVNVQPSFFPGQADAPFGGSLQLGGQFGVDYLALLPDSLYYGVTFWQYAGNPALPYNPAHLSGGTAVEDPLFNKRYLLPTVVPPSGRWDTLTLGPYTGKVTAVAPGLDPAAIGSTVKVYKRPPLPNPAAEYWPFWDLMVIWDSTAAPDGLVVLTMAAYRRTGGTDENPKLTLLDDSRLGNRHLPLCIDNRPPVPVFLPYDPADALGRKFHTAPAHFLVVAETLGPSTPMSLCNEMEVQADTPADGNECILVRYSVQDGSGNAHSHVARYALGAEYTPKNPALPDSLGLGLKSTFAGKQPIAGSYTPTVPPEMQVDNYRSVVVPSAANGWPPEPAGDTSLGAPCPQYAVEVSLVCWVRTVDGWGHLFGSPHVSRHIIIRKS